MQVLFQINQYREILFVTQRQTQCRHLFWRAGREISDGPVFNLPRFMVGFPQQEERHVNLESIIMQDNEFFSYTFSHEPTQGYIIY